MKLILASSDITKVEGGIELVEKMAGKPRAKINVAIINEASAVQFEHHRWAIDTMTSIAANFGGDIEIVHILAIPLEKSVMRIMNADMVWVLGGNTEWLKVVFDRTGISAALPKILETKIYHGSSAGSMILGHRPSSKMQKILYGEFNDFGVEDYLDLVDFSILPHFDSEINEALAIEESKNVNYPVYALSDKSAIIVDGNNTSIIGEDYLKLVKGEVAARNP
jgi:dipeptidase E